MTSDSLLDVRTVSKRFGGFTALDKISMEVRRASGSG